MNTPVANTVAAQNILSGEKSFKSVQFAVTGNALADAIAGVQAVLAGESLLESAKASLLRMLAEVYQREHDAAEAQREMMARMQQPQQYAGIVPAVDWASVDARIKAQQSVGCNAMANALGNIGMPAMPPPGLMSLCPDKEPGMGP